MDKDKKIVLYGAGNRGRVLLELMELCEIPVEKIVDSNHNIWGKKIGKYVIDSPDILLNNSNVKICITIADFLVIAKIRKDYQINSDNEISYLDLIMFVYNKLEVNSFFKFNNISSSDKFSVIFDCEYGLKLGGIEEWTKGICNEFLRQGEFDSYILTNYESYDIPEELKEKILYVDVTGNNAFSPQNIGHIMKCIAEHLPCILITSQPDDVLLAGKIMKEYYGDYIKVVSVIHGGSDEIYKNYLCMKDCTDLYVCVSSDIRRNMIERGVNENKVFTMLCPIECSKILERTYSVNPAYPIRIGYAGRLVVEQKRMDLLLKLISELEKMQVNYFLELAGDGDYDSEIQDFITKNYLQDKVKLIGKIGKDQIVEFWKEKDICINIADYEGRSRTIAEAMANGAIPIVTETSGVHDDIVDGKNGFIVKIGDYRAIAKQVAELDKSREKLSQIGELAHLEIKKKSSMEGHYQFWQKIIGIVTEKIDLANELR